MYALKHTVIFMEQYPPKVSEQFVNEFYSTFKRKHLEMCFPQDQINNLHKNIKCTTEEESEGEVALFDTLLKRNDGKIPVLVYRKPTHSNQCLHYSFSLRQVLSKEFFLIV